MNITWHCLKMRYPKIHWLILIFVLHWPSLEVHGVPMCTPFLDTSFWDYRYFLPATQTQEDSRKGYYEYMKGFAISTATLVTLVTLVIMANPPQRCVNLPTSPD